ncbi:MAG: tetratricopeptide repeat protein, partial [Treponema sp.]|nr:tetratricopeptide repeat protein [Treponema sp.]
EHPDTITVMHEFAVTLRNFGRNEEALKLQQQALDLYKKILLLKASAAKKTAVEAMFKKLNAAQKKAEYKCENFVMAFESKKK